MALQAIEAGHDDSDHFAGEPQIRSDLLPAWGRAGLMHAVDNDRDLPGVGRVSGAHRRG